MKTLQMALALAIAMVHVVASVQQPPSPSTSPSPIPPRVEQRPQENLAGGNQAWQIQLGEPLQTPNLVVPKSLYGKNAAAVVGRSAAVCTVLPNCIKPWTSTRLQL